MKANIPDDLAREIELDRPPRSIWEILFRWCAGLFFGGTLIAVIIRILAMTGFDENFPGDFSRPLTIAWCATFVYFVSYGVLRFVKSPFVRWLWFGTWLGLGALIVFAALYRR